MDYIKLLAICALMSATTVTTVQAQTVEGEQCDAIAATPDTADDCECDDDGSTQALEDDCPLVPPPLQATNLAFIVPVLATALLAGLAAGGDGGSPSDTQ